MSPRTVDRTARRSQLVAAATEVFAEKGVSGSTTASWDLMVASPIFNCNGAEASAAGAAAAACGSNTRGVGAGGAGSGLIARADMGASGAGLAQRRPT